MQETRETFSVLVKMLLKMRITQAFKVKQTFRVTAKLSGGGFLIGSRQRLLQTVARKVA